MLSLVPFGPAHFATLRGWFADERALVQWGGARARFPLDDDQLAAMCADAGLRCWMAADGEELVGHVQLAVDAGNGVGRVCRVAVAPTARGRGLAAGLMEAVLREARAIDPPLARLELEVYTFNAPAIRTYGRAGFEIEGVRRSAVAVDGERWDSMLMALLWPSEADGAADAAGSAAARSS